jgi:hypothetical protein
LVAELVLVAVMCAKNDDPLTTGQGYRTIKIEVGATGTPLTGEIRVHFLGDVAVFSAAGAADPDHEEACEEAFQSMRTVKSATCAISNVDATTKGAVYTVAFNEWIHLGGENNLLYHSGNPLLSSFTCDLSKVTSANTPTCAITDVVVTNAIGTFRACFALYGAGLIRSFVTLFRARVLLQSRSL